MKQNNTPKKRSGIPRLLILLALALFLIAYLTLPAVSRPINRAAAVLGSANVDAVVEYIRSFGAYAMVFSFFLMVFSSVAAPLPAFLITLSNAAIFGWWQGAILSWSSAMAGAAPASSFQGLGATWWNFAGKGARPVWKPILNTAPAVLVCRLRCLLRCSQLLQATHPLPPFCGHRHDNATVVYFYVGSMLTGGVNTW
ncbi:MAG: TVP38/TMEM64 family protein [Enterocloster sp.]